MKVMVMIPTYNEAGDISDLIEKILAQPLNDLEILVVDDNSPDGTAEIVRDISRRDRRVSLLFRPSGRGRGLAGRAGFQAALDRGVDAVVEMDGDGSHSPDDIPRLLEALKDADVVLGSRFVKGGAARDRGLVRDLISQGAKWYLTLIMGMRYADPTTGFRVFSRFALTKIRPDTMRSVDPFIVTEVLYRAHRQNLRVKEVPIVFQNRRHGVSKLKTSILLKYFYRVILLRLREARQ